jgi:uncharacterized repeat protein (TIGR03803 family)
MGNDGHVYGITERGGYDDNGAIFRLNLSGDRSYKELHSFASSESGVYNGAKPNASPVFGNDGYIYGTTTDGGYSNSAPGADKTTGTIYRMHLASGSFQVLFRYAHSGVKFGSIPVAGLVLGKDGYFYGATSDGGAHDSGTVFKIKVTQGNSVTYQVLHSFNDTDGSRPTRSLTVGKDGHLYGVTPWGGAYDCGTIYKINGENGSHTLLHSFNCTDGNAPSTELVMDDDGSFYGMTAGQSGFGGTAYRYIPIGR